MKDELGDRFKAIEHEWKATLPRRKFYVLRADGRAFHTFTRGLEKPFDRSLMTAMDAATMRLCTEISGALCGYVQSDEISIVFTDLTGNGAEPWFGGVVQKIVSISAAVATSAFNEAFGGHGKIAQFDARVIPLDDVPAVADYLWWRQTDSRRNAVSMLAHHYIGKSAVLNLSTRQRVDALYEQAWIDVEEQDRGFVNGRLIRPVKRPGTTTFVRKDTGAEETVDFERTAWESEPSELLRNWFYDNHIERFPVTAG